MAVRKALPQLWGYRWYTDAENDSIRSEARESVDYLTTSPDATDICRRGLEGYLPEGRKRKMSRRLKAWDAVLLEQDAQWEAGIVNIERIAAAYKKYSKKSAMSAMKVGKKDRTECLVTLGGKKSLTSVVGVSQRKGSSQVPTRRVVVAAMA